MTDEFEWDGTGVQGLDQFRATFDAQDGLSLTARRTGKPGELGYGTVTVSLSRAWARTFRDWLNRQPMETAHEDKVTALRAMVRTFEREHGPINAAMMDEARQEDVSE